MLLAAIDIGSNAVRLYFSHVFKKNGQTIVEKASLLRIPIRLGEDVFTMGYIGSEKMEKLLKTMHAFKLLIDVYQPVAFQACATAAMREASNRNEVIGTIAEETGLRIEIIDGLKEASLVSAFTDFHFPITNKYIMYIDVGGGSTELSLLKGQKLLASASFKIGTVRLLKSQVEEEEWSSLKKWLKALKEKRKDLLLVGSGGNINKLTKLYGKIPENILSFQSLEDALTDLAGYTFEERVQVLGMRPDRADVILPAGQIFRFIMKHTGSGMIHAPKIGLSDGMVSSLYKLYQEV